MNDVDDGYASLVVAVQGRGFVAAHGTTWNFAVPYDKEVRTALI